MNLAVAVLTLLPTDHCTDAFPRMDGTESLYERFNVVGFDPRGVPESRPGITCSPAKLYDTGLNRFPSTRAEYAAFVEHNRAAGEDTLTKTGPMLGHAGTKSAAEGVDAIRNALEEPWVSWFGLPCGTELGAVDASSHPDRVDRMVLAGAVDHARPIRQAMIEEAAATEDSLLRFSSWCHGSSECALHGQDVLARYDKLVRREVSPRASTGRAC
ncbi:alpha/beta fold hydrolase [Amycolatopsis panacis]|uniref:alpha/beta fold hydrolase n=1 Tax=Amycolatopsis panacis TaxID=2340917 RepID=UPI001F1A27B7|nr:alpha/beta fold hydrolase [Amycolatopsis panacis]